MSQKELTKERGQALVETAIVLLILIPIVFFIIDLGRAVYFYSVAFNAAREGARFGIIPLRYDLDFTIADIDIDGVIDAARERAVGVDIDINPSDVVLTPKPYKLIVTVRTTFTPVTPFISDLVGGDILITTRTTMGVEK